MKTGKKHIFWRDFMNRKIVFLVALALAISLLPGMTVFEKQAECASLPVYERVDYAHGVVTAYYLNMRQGPSADYYITRVLEKGQAVKVIGKMGTWYVAIDVNSGCVGCVHGNYIQISTTADLDGEEVYSEEDKEAVATEPVVTLSEEEVQILELVNEVRKENDLPQLEIHSQLMQVARLKAQDMVDNGYFSHTSATYGSPWDMMRKNNISFKSAAENIAGNKTVEGAFQAWIADDNHKNNILNDKFGYTGIGITDSPTYGKIVVQQFIGQ